MKQLKKLAYNSFFGVSFLLLFSISSLYSQQPAIEVTIFTDVIDTDGNGVISSGDVANFTIKAKNTGNIALTGITLTTSFTGVNNSAATLSTAVSYTGSSGGSPQGTLSIGSGGEIATYVAAYTFNSAGINAGGVKLSISALGSSAPLTNNVSDTSDDGNDTDGDTTSDHNIIPAGADLNSIEGTKQLSSWVDKDGDGMMTVGDEIIYNITVCNNGYQNLKNLVLDDGLTDSNSRPLAYTAPFTPPGAIFQSSDQAGILDSGIGNGTTTGTLYVGECATYQGKYILDQAAIDSGQLNNCLDIDAKVISSNADVSDRADDGDDTDSNTTNDCTETTITQSPTIEVTKVATVNDVNGNSKNDINDIINYSITVENKGNVSVSSLTFNDTLRDGNGNTLTLTSGPTYVSGTSGSNSSTLLVEGIVTYLATYQISIAAANSGYVSNSLVVIGSTQVANNSVSDTSDDGLDGDSNTVDDPTEITVEISKALEVTKIATFQDIGSGNAGERGAGDKILYTITVTNTGQIALSNITVSDTLHDGNGATLSYDSALSGGSVNPLNPGASYTYQALYTITSGNVGTGLISNSVTVYGSSPGLTNDVFDISDDGIDNDGNLVDDSTVTLLTVTPRIEAEKTGVLSDTTGDGLPGVGDKVSFTIKLTNTGNITLNNISIVDNLTRGNNVAISLDASPTFISATSGSNSSTLLAGEVATWTATFTADAAALATNLVKNQVTVSANDISPSQTQVTDVSDDGDDLDGDLIGDKTEVSLINEGKIKVTKTASITQSNPSKITLGDVVVYTITVENTGNVSLTNLTFVDALTGIGGQILSLNGTPAFVSNSMGTAQGGLLIGEVSTYTASFTVSQAGIDAGGFNNSFVASAKDPANTTIQDASDDGDNSNGQDNPTRTVIPPTPSLEVVKISVYNDANGNSVDDVGDTVSYTITVKNTGNVTLGGSGANQFAIGDTFSTIAGTVTPSLTGPTFQSADAGSSFGILKPGETATFLANFTITQAVVNAGGLSNSVSVTAQAPNGTMVNDVSDDGIDNDGNLDDDPTENIIASLPQISISKTASLTNNGGAEIGVGDLITYSITVTNTGNVDLVSVTLADELKGLNGSSLALTGSLTFQSATQSSNQGSLLVGETALYTASFLINQTAVDAGGVSNTATVSGSVGATTVTATSGDVITNIARSPSIDVTKVASITDVDGDGENSVGDIIVYTITISNTGNITLTNFSVVDTLKAIQTSDTLSLNASPTSSDPASLAPGGTKIFTASFTLTQNAVDKGGVANSAFVSANNVDANLFVNDISDNGDDGDGNSVDDTTNTLISADPKLEVVKTVVNNDVDGDGVVSAGDILTYTVVVSNTGNITLQAIYLDEIITDLQGNGRSLNSSLTWIGNSGSSVYRTLVSGEAGTYTGSYTVVSADETAKGIMNQVVAKSYWYPPPSFSATLRVSDTSDDGDDTDGNITDDKTITYTGVLPAFEVTKTASATDTNGNGVLYDSGDLITFTIVIANTSSDVISALDFVDTFTSAKNRVLSLTTTPTWASGTSGSTSTTLTVGGTSTFIATYSVTSPTIETGGVYNTITFTGSSARNPVHAERDVEDVSDDGIDDDGNITDDKTFFLLGIDTDGDGVPDKTDVDDDNDGIMDREEACLTYLLDGNSFETYWKPGQPVNSSENQNTAYPNSIVAKPFSSVNGDGEIWDAANVNSTQWDPQQGTYYIELLQNAAGYNDLEYWNETDVQSGTFDRIMVEQDVYPSSTYSITFYHKDGGRQTPTHADGGSTVIQVQSMQTNYQVRQITEAPTNWTQQTFTFTTDPQTTSVAILFSAYAINTNVSIQLDSILMGPTTPCTPDIDGDGVPNGLDLDADNDGIFDIVESGNEALDTNNSGRVDFNDTGFVDTDLNGADDRAEANTLKDSDNDGIIDAFELDSDGDGCKDVIEAGYTDNNSDGLLGNVSVTQNASGTVTSGVDGYTAPLSDSPSSTLDYRNSGWDVKCYNPQINVEKTAVVSDVNNSSTTDLGDIITYTITVSNTGLTSVTLTDYDTLSAEEGTFIATLTLDFTSTGSTTTLTPTQNFFKYSSRIDDSANGWSESPSGNYGDGYPDNQNWWPGNVNYYFNSGSGENASTVGMVDGYNNTGGNTGDDVSHNNSYSETSRIRVRGTTGNYLKYFIYQQIGSSNLEPNTKYTISMYAKAYNATYVGDTFKF